MLGFVHQTLMRYEKKNSKSFSINFSLFLYLWFSMRCGDVFSEAQEIFKEV